MEPPPKKVFISYSWDSEVHKAWVKQLADALIAKGVDIILDQYDAPVGTNFVHFMEDSVQKAERVIMVMTEEYKKKADKRSRGTGYEYVMTSYELYDRPIEEGFVLPILRGKDGKTSIPYFLKSTVTLDFSEDMLFEKNLEKLLHAIYGFSAKPKLGKAPDFATHGTPRQPVNEPRYLSLQNRHLLLDPKTVIGRKSERDALAASLKNENRLVLLNGLGGIGKTTLASYYLHYYASEYTHIGWVTYTEDFINNLLTALNNRKVLPEPTAIEREQQYHQLLQNLHQLEGNNLLVIDNINTQQEADAVLAELDRLPSSFKILLTARVQIKGYKEHKVGVLDEAEAIKLFKKYYTFKDTDTENELKALLAYIGRHTLVLEMLAKGMDDRPRQTLRKVLQTLKDKGFAALEVEVRTERSNKQLKKLHDFVDFIFNLSLADIEEDNQLLLRQLSILPAVAHPFELLAYLLKLEEESAQDQLDAQLVRLKKKGLIDYQNEQVHLHPVLQEVIASKATIVYSEIDNVVAQLAALLDYDRLDPKHNLFDRQPYMIYGDKVVEGVENMQEANVSYLLDRLAWLYENLGQYQKAAKLGEQALNIAASIFEANDVTISTRQSNLANVYGALGRYAEASKLLESALQSDLDNFGEQHPSVAVSQSNLATVYRALGRYEEASKLLESALQSDLDNFGEQHPTVAVRQSNLANVYGDLGRYAEASKLLESALQSDLDNFGEQHPSVAVSQSNLATVYRALGRYAEASKLLESALQSDLDNFGEQHPEVAKKQSNLATVYRALGRYEEASKLLESALQSDLDNFGEQHPSVAVRQSNLANVYRDLGRYEEASKLLESALQSDLDNFGEQHSNLAVTYNNLAWVKLRQKQYQTAVEYFIQAYTIFQEHFDDQHPNAQTVWRSLVHTVETGASAADEYCIAMLKKLEEERK